MKILFYFLVDVFQLTNIDCEFFETNLILSKCHHLKKRKSRRVHYSVHKEPYQIKQRMKSCLIPQKTGSSPTPLGSSTNDVTQFLVFVVLSPQSRFLVRSSLCWCHKMIDSFPLKLQRHLWKTPFLPTHPRLGPLTFFLFFYVSQLNLLLIFLTIPYTFIKNITSTFNLKIRS